MGLHQMMALHNSQERTIGQFHELVEGTGWKLESISTSSAGTMSSLVFEHISHGQFATLTMQNAKTLM
jgi:hypothetical protein